MAALTRFGNRLCLTHNVFHSNESSAIAPGQPIRLQTLPKRFRILACSQPLCFQAERPSMEIKRRFPAARSSGRMISVENVSEKSHVRRAWKTLPTPPPDYKDRLHILMTFWLKVSIGELREHGVRLSGRIRFSIKAEFPYVSRRCSQIKPKPL